MSESGMIEKDNKFFFKLKRTAIFSLFALLFILAGIFLASGFEWSSPSHGKVQAITPSKEVGKDQNQFSVTKDQLLFGSESPFVKVAERVSPAVVNISAEKKVKGGFAYEFDPFQDFFRRFFGEVPENRLPAQKSQSLGSGFIFRKDGYVLTNNHVVAGADNISVKFPGGGQYTAKVVGLDKDTDIAVLKIDVKEDLPFVEFGDSDSLKVGEWVMAIGNPFPQLGLDRTVTVGVVSAKGRGNLNFGPEETPNYQNYIQTDASINPGNSGGPLVNIQGEVIGINSAITNPTGIGFNIGIGFAIPVNLAKSVLPDLVEKGKVSRGYLGIGFQEIDQNTAEALNLPAVEGVLVQRVMPDTPAEEAGIKTGDVITQFNGKRVQNGSQFMMMVAEVNPGLEVNLDIIRNGQKITRSLELADREKSLTPTERPEPATEKREDWLGLQVNTSTRELAAQYQVKFHSGVMVLEVNAGSLAEQAGFLTGDIIVKINDLEIADSDAYQKVIEPLINRGKAILFLVYRNGEPFFIAVKAE